MNPKHLILTILAIFAIITIFSTAGCVDQEQPLPIATPEPTQIPTPEPTEQPTQITPTPPPDTTQTPPPQVQPGSRLEAHFIDVGQGDAILIQYNGKNMLIDAGDRGYGSTVVSYLREQSVSRLDYIVATHPHADHIGGMTDVLDAFPVGRFIDSGNPHTSQTYENMLLAIDEKNIPFSVAERGQTINLDSALSIQILNPGPQLTGDLNEDSVVLKMEYGQVAFLLTGDAGISTENLMMQHYDLESEILKVGHHGSRYSSGATFLAAVSPEVSIIMVGEGNRYGHPTDEVLDRLRVIGSQVYRTDHHGTIVIATNGVKYTVTSERGA
ncbi:ComEC/Rec2 family competence protein [Methanocalculus sp. MC3]